MKSLKKKKKPNPIDDINSKWTPVEADFPVGSAGKKQEEPFGDTERTDGVASI